MRLLLRYGVVSVLAIALLLAAAIQIQERILRYRAERLLQDILAIELRHTTFKQVGDLAAKWNGFASHNVPCSKEYCDFSIEFRTPAYGRLYLKIAKAYWLLGGRPGRVFASIQVRNGFVWGETYMLSVASSIGGYNLIGEIATVPATEIATDVWPPSRRHAEYTIDAPEPGGAVWVHFSPYADPADIRRLAEFNFSCITGLIFCRTPEDIMPLAMKESVKERVWQSCDSQLIQILSREADDILLAEIIQKAPLPPDEPDYELVRARLLERIKRGTSWQAGQLLTIPVGKKLRIKSGDHVIVLVSGYLSSLFPQVGTDTCGLILATDENLALVREGAARDERVAPLIAYSHEYLPHKFSEAPPPPPPPPPPPSERNMHRFEEH